MVKTMAKLAIALFVGLALAGVLNIGAATDQSHDDHDHHSHSHQASDRNQPDGAAWFQRMLPKPDFEKLQRVLSLRDYNTRVVFAG